MTYLGFILFFIMFGYHFVYVLWHRPNAVGKIIISDNDSMYLELDDQESMELISNSEYVIFRTSHK